MSKEQDGTGWPDVPGDTALTIKLPAADRLVRADFPAHVTVLYPFLHDSRINATVHRELGEVFGSHDAFTLRFADFRRHPGVLLLDPWPHDPVQALTKELRERWPELLPYRGIFGDEGLDPHLTVSHGEGPDAYQVAYDGLESELAPLLPLTCQVLEVHLIAWDGSSWRDRTTYPLRQRSSAAVQPLTAPDSMPEMKCRCRKT